SEDRNDRRPTDDRSLIAITEQLSAIISNRRPLFPFDTARRSRVVIHYGQLSTASVLKNSVYICLGIGSYLPDSINIDLLIVF
ncbi:MAG: hypothetical protein ACI8TL_002020, partial [Natronomonas sp.]